MTTIAEMIAFLEQFPQDTHVEVSMGDYFRDFQIPVLAPRDPDTTWIEGPFENAYDSGMMEYEAPQAARDAVPPYAGVEGVYRAHDGFPARPRIAGIIRFGREAE